MTQRRPIQDKRLRRVQPCLIYDGHSTSIIPQYGQVQTRLYLAALALLWAPPSPTVAPDELVGPLGSPGAGLIGWQALRRLALPDIQNALHKVPGRLHLVAACEERRVAEHTVEQEALVCLWLLAHKGGAIEKVHIDRANLHLRAWNLRPKFQRDALVRLDAQRQDIRLNLSMSVALLKEHQRRLLELDGDLCHAFGQMFAGAQIERNACPAPAIDRDFQGHIGFGD